MVEMELLPILTVTALAALVPEAGREYLAMVSHGWARDPNAKLAYQEARRNGAYFKRGENWAVIFDAPADAEVDGLGRIGWMNAAKTRPPEAIGRVRFRKL